MNKILQNKERQTYHPERASRPKDLIQKFFVNTQNDKNAERGSVIIFILIAVMLFAALIMTFIRSSTSTSSTAEYERATLAASEILNYTRLLENGVQSLLARGCSENEISFWKDTNGDGSDTALDLYHNPNSPTDFSCHVFRPEGGRMKPFEPKEEWKLANPSAPSWYGTPFYGQSFIRNIGDGITNLDLILGYTGVSKSICNAVNKSLGISGIPDNDVLFNPASGFKGTYLTGGNRVDVAPLFGKTAGCFFGISAGTEYYAIYQVLHVR